MVDGIDANRRKWQEKAGRVSMSDQSTESDLNAESQDDAESHYQEFTQTEKPVENGMFGSKSKCSQDLKCRANRDFCEDQPDPAGSTTSTEVKQAKS